MACQELTFDSSRLARSASTPEATIRAIRQRHEATPRATAGIGTRTRHRVREPGPPEAVTITRAGVLSDVNNAMG